jgi:hypothetical protein
MSGILNIKRVVAGGETDDGLKSVLVLELEDGRHRKLVFDLATLDTVKQAVQLMLAESYRRARAAGTGENVEAEFIKQPIVVTDFRAGPDLINEIVLFQLTGTQHAGTPEDMTSYVVNARQARHYAARLLECANELPQMDLPL